MMTTTHSPLLGQEELSGIFQPKRSDTLSLIPVLLAVSPSLSYSPSLSSVFRPSVRPAGCPVERAGMRTMVLIVLQFVARHCYLLFFVHETIRFFRHVVRTTRLLDKTAGLPGKNVKMRGSGHTLSIA